MSFSKGDEDAAPFGAEDMMFVTGDRDFERVPHLKVQFVDLKAA